MYKSDIITNAIDCIKSGFSVFPIKPKSKEPANDAELGFLHGCKDATKDAAKIIMYVNGHGDCNLGCHVENAIVIDIDLKHGGDKTLAELVKQHGELPLSPSAKTGGGGQHLWFKKPAIDIGNWTNNKTGIDIRTTGGYVVVPPSVHANGNSYEWTTPITTPLADCPTWLLDFIVSNHPTKATKTETPKTETTKTETTKVNCSTDTMDFTFRSEDEALQTHEGASEGERNAVLSRLVGKHLARGDHYNTIRQLAMLWAAKCTPPYPEQEALRTLDSLARKEAVKREELAPSPSLSDDVDDEEEKLRPEAYHGVVGEYVRAIEPHTEADPAAILVSSPIAIGNAMGASPFFETDGDTQHTNLFGVIVGDTGNGRKGVGLKRALQIMDDEFRQRNIATGLSSGEGLISAVRDEVRKLNVRTGDCEISEEGVLDKRLLVCETEFSQTLRVVKREGNTLSPLVRNAFDGMTLSSMTRVHQKATGAHVSIIAHITEKELGKTLTEVDMFNGFANRFMFLRSRRSRYLPRGGKKVNIEPYRDRVRQAIAFAQNVGEMTRSEAAEDRWEYLYIHRLNSNHPILTRALPITSRLSMIYALLDESTVIELVHLEAAYAIWRYAEQSVHRIFGKSDQGVDDAITRKVYEAVVGNAGIGRKELCDVFKRNVKMTIIDEALLRLQASGKVVAMKDEASGKGRPAERWYPTTERRNDETTEGGISVVNSVVLPSYPETNPSKPISVVPESAENTAKTISVVSVVPSPNPNSVVSVVSVVPSPEKAAATDKVKCQTPPKTNTVRQVTTTVSTKVFNEGG